MALSRTSRELNSLTVENLFSRGSLLSSSQAYIPVLSSITNGFNQWINTPVSTIYYNFFKSYYKPDELLDNVNHIINSNNNIYSSINNINNSLLTFSNINYSTLIMLSNIDNSTINSYYSSLLSDYSTSLIVYSNISTTLFNDVPGLLTTVNTFRTQLFSQNASTLLIVGSNYYGNPGGSRFIGPGLSSLYNNSLDPNNLSSLTGYGKILSNSSTSWYNSNRNLSNNINSVSVYVNNFNNTIENGSSISSLYGYSNSSIIGINSLLPPPPVFFNTICSFSSLIFSSLNSYIIPSRGPTISTASTLLHNIELYSYSTLIGNINPNTLFIPMTLFSNSIQYIIQSTINTIASYNYIAEFSNINFRYSTIFKPVYDPLNISTNIYGYNNLYSSIYSGAPNYFSTISSRFPYFVGKDVLTNINTLANNIPILYTTINNDNSTIRGLIGQYATSTSLASLSNNFKSEINMTIIDYGNRISSILIPFYNSLSNINSIPGLCTMNLTTTIATDNIMDNINNIITFITYIYPQEQDQFFYDPSGFNYTDISTSVTTNIKTYISSSTSAYSTTLYAYSSISTNLYISVSDINNFTDPKFPGSAYQLFGTYSSIQSNTLSIINNIGSSNSYFTGFTIISDYSTSTKAVLPGTIVPSNYIMRSTFFTTVKASSISKVYPVLNLKTLYINELSSSYNLGVGGPVNIIPYSITNGNFIIGNIGTKLYSQTYGINSIASLSSFGTAIFEESMIVSGIDIIKSYNNNILPINKSLPNQLNPISSTTRFYDPSKDTLSTFNNKTDIKMFYNTPYYSYFQLDYNDKNQNKVMYVNGLDITSPTKYYTFNSTITSLATYNTLGPITSFTTNGSYYLITATSNTYNNYSAGYWYPTRFNKYYTLFITSNINFSEMRLNEFSTPFISDPPVELHDSIWTGKNWIVAGNGVYTSKDTLSWNQVLPPSSERLLQYKSMDFNGQDILLAHISSTPQCIEFLKSTDGGNTWGTTSYINMPNTTHSYNDIGISTSIYSINIKWAFNTWNAYINSITNNLTSILLTSSDGGYTWASNNIAAGVLPSKDTNAILFQPIQNIKPSIELPNFHIYTRDDPVKNPTIQSLSARFSSIIFNEGDLTIKRRYNSQLTGLIGINTIYPAYALDIGMGNARKPSGTQWINPSDERIKQDICDPNSLQLINEISSLRLVKYKWIDSYAKPRGLSEYPILGFISQEIEAIYPSSVLYSQEAGFGDFRTLDTDQLFKAKFGLTRQLLDRASRLQSRITRLLNNI